MDQIKVGKFLAELRKKEKLTQEDLGEKIGVTNKTISRWENGTYMPDIEMFLILSKFYNVSVNELLCGEYLSQEEFKEKSDNNILMITRDNKNSIKRVIKTALLAFLCFCFLSIFAGAFIYSRHKFLYPKPYDKSAISKKHLSEEIIVAEGECGNYLYKDNHNDISVYLSLPGYVETNDSNVFKKGDSYIVLRTYYTSKYPLPTTAELQKYFANKNLLSYTEKCLFAMNYNLDKVTIFSSETDIDIASGVRMLLMYINFPNKSDENYGYVYPLKGKWNGYIVSNGKPEVSDTVWSIVLEDNYRLLFITIKDAEFGHSTEKISQWLSSIQFAN